MNEIDNLKTAMTALEAQRPILGDAVVDTALASLREKLSALLAAAGEGEPHSARGQRKQVTVLFADVFGYTALSEKFDAEDVTELMNTLWMALDSIIVSYGGLIDKHMGDGVLALWGTEQSREDDIERAVRAALLMQQAVNDWGEEKRPVFVARDIIHPDEPRPPLSMRIGIHTGPVLIGEIGASGEFSVMGDTVNTANRIEAAAPPGGVLISQNVYHMVRGIFDLRPLGPLEFKGKSEPVSVYVVERLRPRAFRVGTRGVEGVETRMVGRQPELAHLMEMTHITAAQKRAHMITIIGEAGIGKSRLLHEFLVWLETQPGIDLFKARADEELQRIPYALLRDMFTERFDIRETDSVDVVRARLETGFSEFSAGDPQSAGRAGLIGQLLGYETHTTPQASASPPAVDARQLRNQALVALADYMRAAAAKKTLVLLLDDLHWSDDSSLDVIPQMAQVLGDQPVLFVCAARPVLNERRAMWGEALENHSRLELSPLSATDSLDLVGEIFQHAESVPEQLRELIVRNAEGNPFYVEELVKMLLDDGVIVKEIRDPNEGELWRIDAARLGALRVPPTLNGILQARFDSLPAEERQVLQQASVVGRIFWEDTLRHITRHAADPSAQRPGENLHGLADVLGMLRRREMVFARPESSFADTREYVFKHALLRDAVYESILKRVRRSYHALVADWLMRSNTLRTAEVTGLIADHLEQAGDAAQAVIYLQRSGQQAAGRFANAEALGYFSRALALVPIADARVRAILLLEREKLLDLQGERDKQSRDLESLQALADRVDDPALRAEVALRQARFAQQTSDYARAIDFARQSIAFARSAADVALESQARLALGRAYYRLSNYQAARLELEQALAQAQPESGLAADILQSLVITTLYQGDNAASQHYLEQTRAVVRKTGDRRVEANLLHSIGTVRMETDPNAVGYFLQALSIYREIGDRRGEAQTLQQLGVIFDRRSDFSAAQAHYLQALDLYRRVGDRLGEGWMLNAVGALLQYQRQLGAAEPYFEAALDIYRAIHVPWGEAISLHNLGVTALSGGRYECARQHLRDALDICQGAGDRWGEIWRMSYLALLEHQCGNHDLALQLASEALNIAVLVDASRERSMVLCHGAHALAALGRWQDAARDYREAQRIRLELGEAHLAAEAQAGLARTLLAMGDGDAAAAQADEVYTFVLAHPDLYGIDEPVRVLLTCAEVFQSRADPRAAGALSAARALLDAWLTPLDEPARAALRSVPHHRALLER